MPICSAPWSREKVDGKESPAAFTDGVLTLPKRAQAKGSVLQIS